jgi:hypothetical protein
MRRQGHRLPRRLLRRIARVAGRGTGAPNVPLLLRAKSLLSPYLARPAERVENPAHDFPQELAGRALAVVERGGRVLGRLGEYGRLEVGARVEQVDLGDGVVAAHCRRVERATRTR